LVKPSLECGSDSGPTGTLDPGGTGGDIVVRERQQDAATGADANRHISAFLDFDLSSVPAFDTGAGDTAVLELDFQGRLNTNNHFLSVAQITGGSWNSTTSLPS